MIATVSRHRFSDPEEYVAATAAAGGLVVPMGRTPWHLSRIAVAFGGLQLQGARMSPQIRRDAVFSGHGLVAERMPPGAMIHLGHEVPQHEVLLHGHGAPLETSTRAPVLWMRLGFASPEGMADATADWAGGVPGPGRGTGVRMTPQDHAALMATIWAGIRAVARSPDLARSPAGLAGLGDSVLLAVARGLAGSVAWVAQERATAARLRTVRRAMEAAAALPLPRCTMTDLAGEIGVAPRTLHAAFASVYGCSAHRFLKRWRLAMVRRALLAEGGERLVKTIALDHGFWHLGHFARDYRAMFGEHPAETRRVARAPVRGVVFAGTPPAPSAPNVAA